MRNEIRDLLRMLGLELGEEKHMHRFIYLLERLAELDAQEEERSRA